MGGLRTAPILAATPDQPAQQESARCRAACPRCRCRPHSANRQRGDPVAAALAAAVTTALALTSALAPALAATIAAAVAATPGLCGPWGPGAVRWLSASEPHQRPRSRGAAANRRPEHRPAIAGTGWAALAVAGP